MCLWRLILSVLFVVTVIPWVVYLCLAHIPCLRHKKLVVDANDSTAEESHEDLFGRVQKDSFFFRFGSMAHRSSKFLTEAELKAQRKKVAEKKKREKAVTTRKGTGKPG